MREWEFLGRVLAALSVALSSLVWLLLPAPVQAAQYQMPVLVTGNSSAANYTMLGVGWNQNNTWLAANGFINSTGNDTAIQDLSGTSYPIMNTDNATYTAIPVKQNSQTSLYFTTGGTSTQYYQDIIPGYGGNVTTLDSAATEPSSNFSIAVSGYVNTASGAGKNIFAKSGAISLAVSSTVSGNVTGTVTGSTGLTATLAPNGVGTYTNITTLVGAATHWQAELTNDGDTSYVTPVGVSEQDSYVMQDSSIPSYAVIDSVTVSSVVKGGPTSNRRVINSVFLGGVEVSATNTASDGNYALYSNSLSRPSGGSWTAVDIPSIEAGITLQSDDPAGAPIRSTQVYVTVAYHYPDAIATAIGVSSGEHTITMKGDSSLLGVAVDRATYGIMPVGSNVTMNIPFWSTSASGSSFTSKDTAVFTVTPTGTTWSNVNGRTLNGTSDLITVTNKSALAIANNLSVLVWAKIPTPPADYPSIIERGDLWNAHTGYAIENNAGSSQFRVRLGNGTTSVASDWIPYTSANFNQIGITFTNPTAHIYVNGVETSNFTMAASIADGNADVILGKSSIRGTYLGMTIGEAQIYDKALTATEINNGYQATKWKYDGSTDNYEYAALNNAVIDNANGWTFNQNNVMPYTTYVKEYVGGNLKVWYQPTSLILGANLPNQAVPGSDNGTINFGANPTGVTVAISSMVSTGQPAIGTTTTTSSQDLLPSAPVSNWYTPPQVSTTLLNNPIRPLILVMTMGGSNITETQAWTYFGLGVVLVVTVATALLCHGHYVLSGIACSAAIVGLISQTIWPVWALVFIVVAIIGGLVAERAPWI